MTSTHTHTLERDGALLAYDVHDPAGPLAPDPGRPPLLLVGSPMSAEGFTSLRAHFPDRVVVTYDPRGAGRSTLDPAVTATTPQDHAADVAAVLDALGLAQVQAFGSSGGAVNLLALVTARPELVSTLVAHEPPMAAFLPDRELWLEVNTELGATYRREGFGPATAAFITYVSIQGPITAEHLAAPAPDPAAFGLGTDDDGTRRDPLFGLNNASCVPYEPDLEALRAAPTRVLVACGVESRQGFTGRAAAGLAEAMGSELVVFPSHHAGFLGGEFGQQGEPEAFAARLREVLEGSAADQGQPEPV
ncbi:alpha/beta hydrolase [Nocardioides nanhaiensis]|uniref:Alpha/beta hydrolase n=1 Tax=Nocardioides nanhaiensis TaxID=1476871 RepID=A0ABP8VNF5_9ACTN